MSFQKTVLIVAFVVLIIFLAIIGLSIRSAVQNGEFPPEVGQCPDYWKTSHNVNGLSCSNVKNLPSGHEVTGCDTMDLSDAKYHGMGDKAMRAKCQLANSCHVTWDGITNGVDLTGKKWC